MRGRIVANDCAHVAFSSGVELLCASGSDVGAVFDDVAQQVLFAQQPGWHALAVVVLERMHDRAERRTGATTSAAAITTESMILLTIVFLCSTIRAARRTHRARVPALLMSSNGADKFALKWQPGFGTQ